VIYKIAVEKNLTPIPQANPLTSRMTEKFLVKECNCKGGW